MLLRYLSLTNFRNYARLELTLPDRPVLLYGGNAQGKTSLLEAIFLLAAGSSPLASSDRELIRWQAEAEGLPYARVWAELERDGGRMELDIALEKHTLSNGHSRLQKTIRVNRTQKRQSELSGKLNVVLFTPRSVELISGAPAGRRRYMDDALCQVQATYSEALERYTKALRQRNAALRHVRDEGGNPAQLAPFESTLARNGVVIARQRRDFLNALSGHARGIHKKLTGNDEWLRLDYLPNVNATSHPALKNELGIQRGPERAPGSDVGSEELVEAYRRTLVAGRPREIARGMTTFGPHRDEIRFIASSPMLGTHQVDLGTYGSRGQQRTAVLSLKLAELQWMREQTHETPVLLLDEVLAELDRSRRAYLQEQVNSVEQAILTATDPEMFNAGFVERAASFEVEGGIVHSG